MVNFTLANGYITINFITNTHTVISDKQTMRFFFFFKKGQPFHIQHFSLSRPNTFFSLITPFLLPHTNNTHRGWCHLSLSLPLSSLPHPSFSFFPFPFPPTLSLRKSFRSAQGPPHCAFRSWSDQCSFVYQDRSSISPSHNPSLVHFLFFVFVFIIFLTWFCFCFST